MIQVLPSTFLTDRTWGPKTSDGMSTVCAEHRAAPRAPIDIELPFLVEGYPESDRATNISSTGIYLRAEAIFALGTRLDISLELPGTAVRIRCEGVVVRLDMPNLIPRGMGVEFNGLTRFEKRVIDAFVRRTTS